jgi:hypothetical protein
MLLPRFSFLILLAAMPSLMAAQDRRLAERLDSVTALAVQHLVDSAATERLPTEPLVQKALEGKTLGADGIRIRQAVAVLLGQLGRAREALGRGAGEAELTAGAGALRAGLPPGALRRLQSLRSGRSLVVPIAVLTDLVAEGVPPDDATQSVLALARDGRPDDEFLALRRRVQSERRSRPSAEPPPSLRPAADPPVEQ